MAKKKHLLRWEKTTMLPTRTIVQQHVRLENCVNILKKDIKIKTTILLENDDIHNKKTFDSDILKKTRSIVNDIIYKEK